jgi:hypothetical protein
MRVVDRCHGDDDRVTRWRGACINSYDFYDFVTLSAQQCLSSVDLKLFYSIFQRLPEVPWSLILKTRNAILP